MELKNCTHEYWDFVRLMRTHPDNQQYFFSQVEITEQQQTDFMTKNSQKYKICVEDGTPIGYIGLINENEITYCVHPKHQGRGVGTFMVSEFIKLYDHLVAFVLPNNIGSCRVFEKLGFTKQIYYVKNKNA